MIDDNDTQDRAPETAETSTAAPASEKPRRPRGFAAMDPTLVSELAKRGGKAAHRAGTAHQFTSEEARVAGRKGGQATHAKRRAKAGADPTIQH
jgi:general stress protein YciG